MKKFNRLVIVVCVLTSVVVLLGCPRKNIEDTSKSEFIKIGYQGPLTGPIAIFGLQTLAGIELAVAEANEDENGVNGKKIKLEVFDSRGEKTLAANGANRLITQGICAGVGEPTSGAYFASRDIYNRNSVPVISAGATAEGVTVGREFVFRNTLLDTHGAPYLIDYMMEKRGFKRFAIITAVNNDFSVGVSNVFRDYLNKSGAVIVVEQTISDSDTDVSAQITSLRGKDIDAVIYTGYYEEASLILLEMEKKGIDAILIGADGLQSPQLWNVAKDASIGTIFYAGFAMNSEEEIVQTFNRKLGAIGLYSDLGSSQGYDATKLLIKSIREAGVVDCSSKEERSKIRDILAETKDYKGVSGLMSFDEDRSAIKVPFLQEIYKMDNGSYSTRILK